MKQNTNLTGSNVRLHPLLVAIRAAMGEMRLHRDVLKRSDVSRTVPGQRKHRYKRCAMSIGLLFLGAEGAPTPANTDVNQFAGIFETACVTSFPDLELTKAKAVAAGWAGFSARILVKPINSLSENLVYFRKGVFEIRVDSPAASGKRCQVSANLGKRTNFLEVADAVSARLKLPHAAVEGRQNDLDWQFRDGHVISLSRLSNPGHGYNLSIAEKGGLAPH